MQKLEPIKIKEGNCNRRQEQNDRKFVSCKQTASIFVFKNVFKNISKLKSKSYSTITDNIFSSDVYNSLMNMDFLDVEF